MIGAPPLLLLDEPTRHLDPIAVAEFHEPSRPSPLTMAPAF